jgi:hypothetical protein
VKNVVIAAIVASAGVLAMGQAPPNGPAASGPLTTHAAGYYDATLQRVVLVGSAEEPTASARDHVWSWTGSRWDVVTADGPPARYNGGAAFDARRGSAVVAGGARRAAGSDAFEILAETWLGKSAGWQRMSGTDFDARDHQSMVYDDRRQAVVMFGGIPADRSAAWPSDTWQLGDDGWRRIATDGPAGRARAAMIYDSRRRQVVMFGGVGASPARGQPQPFFNDTWILDGSRWRQAASGGPRPRYAHGMVFDERAGVVLLYSGAAAHKNAPLSDMWQWDGTRWTEIPLTGPTPGYRYQPVMIYDRHRGKTVLYGGIDKSNDTWEWDGRRWVPGS